jgi:predicted transcriptional regulator
MGMDAQITFRTDDEMKEEMVRIAKNVGKKPSQLMNEILYEYLKRYRENQTNELEAIRQMLQQQQQEIAQLKQQHQELAKKSAA